MKARLLLVPLAMFSTLMAGTPVVLVQPRPQLNLVSPLTTTTAQSNQQLLNQVNSTLSQRQFEHQLTTVQTAIRTQTFPQQLAPAVVIQPR